MKTLHRFCATAFIAASLTFSSCSSDDGGGGSSTPNGTYIKATVDGAAFQTLEIQGQSLATALKTGTGSGTLIMIQGSGDMNGSQTMVINMMGITGIGTYDVNADSDGTTLAFVESGSTTSYDTSNCAGATGTLNITHYDDTKVEGTFSFVGKVDEDCSMSKTITNGSFRGVYMQSN
jgi:hypothetical protein